MASTLACSTQTLFSFEFFLLWCSKGMLTPCQWFSSSLFSSFANQSQWLYCQVSSQRAQFPAAEIYAKLCQLGSKSLLANRCRFWDNSKGFRDALCKFFRLAKTHLSRQKVVRWGFVLDTTRKQAKYLFCLPKNQQANKLSLGQKSPTELKLGVKLRWKLIDRVFLVFLGIACMRKDRLHFWRARPQRFHLFIVRQQNLLSEQFELFVPLGTTVSENLFFFCGKGHFAFGRHWSRCLSADLSEFAPITGHVLFCIRGVLEFRLFLRMGVCLGESLVSVFARIYWGSF